MSAKFKKANITINKTGKFLLKIYFHYKYKIDFDKACLDDLRPPYLILANHTNNLDPFFIGVFIKEPVYFVTADEQFRNPIKGFFLSKLVRAIPKKKFVPDIITVKEIIRVVKNNGIVGIFPEGQRNWDGETLEIVHSTTKLIKLLEIPVVIATIKGAHLAHPRWGRKNRKGKVYIKYSCVFIPETIKKMSIEDIHNNLNMGLYHNEYDYQAQAMNIYTGRALAENLELFLFTCPHCKAIGSMQSNKSEFYCNNCNYSVIFNEYGYFEKTNIEPYFSYPGPWGKWQIENLKQLTTKDGDSDKTILEDKNVTVYISSRLKPLKKIYYGNIALRNNTFFIEDYNNQIKTFELNKITGINVQYNNQFEFYYNEQLFRFKFDRHTVSAYKWVSALNIN